MKRFLVLGTLFALLATGLVFGQQEQEQQQGQPIIFQLFGINWTPIIAQTLGSFDDLGVKVIRVWARDTNGAAGIVEIILITNQDVTKYVVVGGRIKPYSSEEQGFYLKEEDKTLNLNEDGRLEWRGYDDQNGEPVLEFYVVDSNGAERIIRAINIKKFVEENFKDED